MIYLYAGLGVLMISGIMAIFEMGLSLTGQSMLPIPTNAYKQSSDAKVEDKRLISLLERSSSVKQGLASQSLCTAILQSYSDKYPGQSAWQPDHRMPIDVGRWIRSCQLNRGSHRVLIMPPDPGKKQKPYQLFSCILTGGNDQCSFEQE